MGAGGEWIQRRRSRILSVCGACAHAPPEYVSAASDGSPLYAHAQARAYIHHTPIQEDLRRWVPVRTARALRIKQRLDQTHPASCREVRTMSLLRPLVPPSDGKVQIIANSPRTSLVGRVAVSGTQMEGEITIARHCPPQFVPFCPLSVVSAYRRIHGRSTHFLS